MNNRKIGLGTAQFGMRYGVANGSGQVTAEEAARIVAFAAEAGMDTIDTAAAYGGSEACLGKIGVSAWRVTSKLPAAPQACPDLGEWVAHSVRGSLDRLGLSRLHAMLLHHPADILGAGGEALYAALQSCREQGLVGRFGVSVYGPDELDQLWHRFRFDIVQVPFSVVDRRLLASGWLDRLRGEGVEVHVRSVFLQGLLLMDRSGRPAAFSRWEALWRRWDEWLHSVACTPLQACLGFVCSLPQIDRVIVGVDSLAHLKDILSAAGEGPGNIPPELASGDADLVNPSRWPAL